MEVIYPNQPFYEEAIHGLPLFETAKRVVRRSIKEFREQADHKAKAEEYDYLVEKVLRLIQNEFGEDVKVLMYEEHDITAEIVLREYPDTEEGIREIHDRIDRIRDVLWTAQANWMRANGIRRGCWGCDETTTVPGRKRCDKDANECGKYVKRLDGELFPHVWVTTHYAGWDDCVEYYNGRYKGDA